jgi:hypothetical protein
MGFARRRGFTSLNRLVRPIGDKRELCPINGASMQEILSDNASSVSFSIAPYDSRCRYWAKVVRSHMALPIPSTVHGANDIPGPYSARGDEELFVGDLVIEGEANHHRRSDRGWSYWVHFVDASGNLLTYRSGFSDQKAAAKIQGLAPAFLAGSGDVAAAIRVAHALRLGMNLPGAQR